MTLTYKDIDNGLDHDSFNGTAVDNVTIYLRNDYTLNLCERYIFMTAVTYACDRIETLQTSGQATACLEEVIEYLSDTLLLNGLLKHATTQQKENARPVIIQDFYEWFDFDSVDEVNKELRTLNEETPSDFKRSVSKEMIVYSIITGAGR